MQRITWKHTQTSDFRSAYGAGIRPMVRTELPEGNILRSELARAILAARRAYSRMYDVHVSRVAASPVYDAGQVSIVHVNAYIPGHHFTRSPIAGTLTCARCGLLPMDAEDIESDCIR